MGDGLAIASGHPGDGGPLHSPAWPGDEFYLPDYFNRAYEEPHSLGDPLLLHDEPLPAGEFVNDGGGGGGFTYPLQVVQTGAKRVQVRFGTVNGVQVTGTAPALEDGTTYTVSDGSKLWVLANLDTNSSVTTANIVTTQPVDSGTVAGKLLASFSVADGSIDRKSVV